MSAIIDRQSAAAQINEAEHSIEEASTRIKGIADEISNLSNVVKAQSNSTMFKAMKDFYDDLNTEAKGLREKFTGSDGVNNNLMQLVNNSGDTDSGTFRLNVGNYAGEAGNPPKPHDVLTGIGNLNDIYNLMTSYSNKMKELDSHFTNAINAYKKLFQLADEHDDIRNSSHSAAESVRNIANVINGDASQFSSQLGHHIEYWAEKEKKLDAASQTAIKNCETLAKNSTITLPTA